MSLENRIRNHLQDQSDALDVDAPGSATVAARSRARRQRRQSAFVAAFALALLGVGGWLLNATGDGDTSTLEVAEAVDGTASTPEEGSTPAQAEATATDAAIADTAAIAVDEIVRPEPGTPLTFTSIEDERAPGGWNVAPNGHESGLYYVLSTAPASGDEQVAAGEWQRNDTLYTWADGEWRTGTFADRFVTDVSVTNGVFYSISTGTRAGSTDLEVGTSADGGATWTWATVDLSDQFGEDTADWPVYNAASAPTNDGQLVVVSRASGADWEQGMQLAQDAGLDVSFETHVIYGIDATGITYGPTQSDYLNPCARDFEEAILESGIYEYGEGLDVPDEDATQAEIDAYAAAMEEARAAYRSTVDAILADLATRSECADHVKCQRTALARSDWAKAEADAVYAELGIDPLTDYWPTLTAEEQATLDERFEGIHDGGPADPVGVDCEEALYGTSDDVPEPTTTTWESLGVVPPAEWTGSVAAYLVDANGSRLVDAPFRPGVIDSVEAEGANFTVRISEFIGGNALITEWSGVPGGEWVERPATGGVGTNVFAGASFGLDWESAGEGDEFVGPTLLRRDATGTTGMRLEDLAPELDTEGFELQSVQTGAYGVVAVALEFGIAASDADTPGAFRNSIVLYSSDGVTWGATELPGVEITTVIVGDDGVMAFTTRPDLVGTTDPRPVLLGS